MTRAEETGTRDSSATPKQGPSLGLTCVRAQSWINEPTKVFVARRGVHELTTTILTGDEVRDLVEKMLKSSGRRVGLSTPFVEANHELGQVGKRACSSHRGFRHD